MSIFGYKCVGFLKIVNLTILKKTAFRCSKIGYKQKFDAKILNNLFMRVIYFFILNFTIHLHVFSQVNNNKIQIGIASYYAKKFEGRKCASGQIFKNDSLTAAHKTLKFGTKVKVTNLKNDSVVIVKINDRLPKKSHRSIDLTQRAAKQLNFIKFGTTTVKIETLNNSTH